MTRHIWILFLAIISTGNGQLYADPLPAHRRTDWTYTGVPGGIPQRATICATFTPGVTATTINNAIVACSKAGGGVIQLAAGEYQVTGIQLYASNVTLRGDGAGRTILRGAKILALGNGGNQDVAIPLSGGGTRGSRSVQVSSVSGLLPGTMIELERDNDPSYARNLVQNGDSRNLRQVNRIVAINGNTLVLQNPLFIDFTAGHPQIHHIFSVTSLSGVEALTLDHSGAATSSTTSVSYCYACWIKGVESVRSNSYHFMLVATLNMEIRDVYIHEAVTYGPNNAGLAFYGNPKYGSNSNGKIENSIFDRLFPAIELQNSSSGFYIGYNYFHGSSSTAQGTGVTWTMLDNHGSHDMMNLWEGNVGEMYGSDGYYGGSSHGVAFRNYITGANPRGGVDNPIRLNRLSYFYSIVGNVLGSPGLNPSRFSESEHACSGSCTAILRLGYPNIGNSSLVDTTGYPVPGMTYPDGRVKSTLFLWGNYDYYHKAARWSAGDVPADVPVPVSNALPASYYYVARPDWFPYHVPWPLIGPDVSEGDAEPSGRVGRSPAMRCWQAMQAHEIPEFNAATCFSLGPATPQRLRTLPLEQ